MLNTLFVLGLVACGGDPAPECVDNGQCDEGEACIADVCLAVDCLSSAICDIGEYCNLDTYTCVDGCLEDADCIAGETCNPDTRSCEAYGCRSTELDCGVGTECDVASGECLAVDACNTCNPQNVNSCQGQDTAYCLVWDDPQVGWCFPECNRDKSCPSGFSCYENFPISVFDTANICIADCPWLTEEGYL